VPMTAV